MCDLLDFVEGIKRVAVGPKAHIRMPRYSIPQNIGKVRVAMGLGGKYTVWNGKQGKHEFVIACRNRKQAEQLATIINSKNRPAEIEVHG